jgi:LuxR family quorum sensing-dependent transcriptional regulator
MATSKSPYFSRLLEAIEDMNRCESADAIAQRLTAFSRSFGYEFAAYIAPPTQGGTFKSRLVLGNWPKGWVSQYSQPGWNECDRVAGALRTNKKAFTWSSVAISEDDKKARRVMDVAARDFGMRSGICVPIHDASGYRSGFSYSGSEADQTEEAVGVIQLISFYAESQLRSVRKDAGQKKILTPREREVLLWVAAGKSTWDMAQILKISEGTVNTIARNAMAKLDVHKRAQAVAEALRLGELIP